MNISKSERFYIRHQTAINIIIYSVAAFIFGLSDRSSIKAAIAIAFLAIIFFISLVQDRLHITATKTYEKDLDPQSAVSLTEELLKIRQKDSLYEKQKFYDALFEYYISLGDTEKVINLYTEIKRANKKIEKSYDLHLGLFLCTAYLNRGEKHLYDTEINKIQVKLSESKTARNCLKRQFQEVKLLEEALYGNNNPKFEKNVFGYLYKIKPNGKITNKKPSDIQKIAAYGLLFIYYKSNGNSEKATEYARKTTEICNEQFVVYRKAKEYLENANKCN